MSPYIIPGLKHKRKLRNYSIESIFNSVSEITGISIDKLKGPRGNTETVEARYITMMIIRQLTGKNKSQIGTIFGRDHTTVIYGLKMAKNWIDIVPSFKSKYHDCLELIQGCNNTFA